MLYENEQPQTMKAEKTFRETLTDELCSIVESFSEAAEEIKKSFSQLKENISSDAAHDISIKERLEYCYGECVCIANLSFSEIVRWLKGKREGFDTIIFKLDDKRLNELLGSESGPVLSLGDDKYIIAAILDENTIKDSLLICYENLDAQLEEILSGGEFIVRSTSGSTKPE